MYAQTRPLDTLCLDLTAPCSRWLQLSDLLIYIFSSPSLYTLCLCTSPLFRKKYHFNIFLKLILKNTLIFLSCFKMKLPKNLTTSNRIPALPITSYVTQGKAFGPFWISISKFVTHTCVTFYIESAMLLTKSNTRFSRAELVKSILSELD